MKLLLATVLMLSGSGGLLSKAEDLNAVNIRLINSMFAVSGEQFQRAQDYINQYNSANLNLTLVAGKIQANFIGVFDLTPLQTFLSDIQATLNSNVQQLTVKFSPANVQSFILGYYQSFLTNLLLNNGTAADIQAMQLVYYGKILSPNATDCYNRYNELYSSVYSKAAANFSDKVENEVASTVARLDTLRKEIQTLITSLVGSFEQIIEDGRKGNIVSAVAAIGSFIATNTLTVGSNIVNWVTEFSALMNSVQKNIKDGFVNYDKARVNETLQIVQQALDCLKAA